MVSMKDCYIDSCKKRNAQGTCQFMGDFCPKLFKVDALFDKTLLSEQQKKRITLISDKDGTDYNAFLQLKSVEKGIYKFVSGGKNLFIHSTNTGNGKTSWAVRLIQAYILKMWPEYSLDKCPALFINVPRFLIALKDNISMKSEYIEYIKKNIFDADLVVWDEIGVKDLSEFDHEQLLNIINYRLDEGKSNVYTSNLSTEELKQKLGDRLYSRIVNYSIEIEFRGADKRSVYKK